MDPNIPPALLDLDLGTIDTSFPVIRGGMYELVITDATVERTAAGTGDMLTVKFATTIDVKGVKGEDYKAGKTTLFHRVGLTPTDKYDHEAIAKNVARLIQAVKPPVSGIKVVDIFNGGLATACKVLQGRMVQAKVEALPEGLDKKSGKTLPPRNEITQLVKAS